METFVALGGFLDANTHVGISMMHTRIEIVSLTDVGKYVRINLFFIRNGFKKIECPWIRASLPFFR